MQEKVTQEDTPDDLLEKGYQKIKEARMTELMDKVIDCSPNFFQKLILDLLLEMGYGGGRADAGKVTGKTGDGGIDGEINEDALGLE
ncbi:MAG: restriction endonuclease, partial [Nitrososphaeraceae archaeon]